MYQKCIFTNADLLYLVCHWPMIAVLWKYIIKTTSDIVQNNIPQDPEVWMLEDLQK